MLVLLAAGLSSAAAAAAEATAPAMPTRPLSIYYVDVEGGQATLFIAPSGESVLIDTGNAGNRDAQRIMAAVHAAGVTRIDYLLITHYHGDHVGGYLALEKLVPILHYVDHGPTVQPEQTSDSRTAYDTAVLDKPHRIVKPGDRLPIAGLDWTIVSAAGRTLTASLPGAPYAGRKNPYCADYVPKEITSDLENAQSVGSVVAYGKFRTIDLGDLLWNWEAQLACPLNLIGRVDLLLVTHHGMNWSGPKALVYALHPRVAIMANGATKGAHIDTFRTLQAAPGLENLWQLHWSVNGLLENSPSSFIANIETPQVTAAAIASPPAAPVSAGVSVPPFGDPEHTPAYWLKVDAYRDGAFTVTNSRNGFAKTYLPRD